MATATKTTRRSTRSTGGQHDQPAARARARAASAEERPEAGTTQTPPERVTARPRAAAEHATRHNSVHVSVPFLGTVRLPASEELAFLGGIGVLAVVGVIEWPVAVALAAGHALAHNRRNKVVREFGAALEEA